MSSIRPSQTRLSTDKQTYIDNREQYKVIRETLLGNQRLCFDPQTGKFLSITKEEARIIAARKKNTSGKSSTQKIVDLKSLSEKIQSLLSTSSLSQQDKEALSEAFSDRAKQLDRKWVLWNRGEIEENKASLLSIAMLIHGTPVNAYSSTPKDVKRRLQEESEEQYAEICKALTTGKRLCYDTKIERFTAISKKAALEYREKMDPTKIVDLESLQPKLMKQIQQSTFSRTNRKELTDAFIQRANTLRNGWSFRAPKAREEQAKLLESIAFEIYRHPIQHGTTPQITTPSAFIDVGEKRMTPEEITHSFQEIIEGSKKGYVVAYDSLIGSLVALPTQLLSIYAEKFPGRYQSDLTHDLSMPHTTQIAAEDPSYKETGPLPDRQSSGLRSVYEHILATTNAALMKLLSTTSGKGLILTGSDQSKSIQQMYSIDAPDALRAIADRLDTGLFGKKENRDRAAALRTLADDMAHKYRLASGMNSQNIDNNDEL